MGREAPRVWSAAGQVDPLTGLAPFEHLRATLGEALVARRLPLVVAVVELPSPGRARFDTLEHSRRLTLAGAMARAAFGPALAVGRLGVRRVGVLSGRDADLRTRTELLDRMVRELPATVRLHPISGSLEVADWALRQLAARRDGP
jgi:hypothetical protein